MIPVKNSVKHDPANGAYGDCHRACFATILGLPADQVPHFYEKGPAASSEETTAHIEAFLRGHGLVQGHALFDASATPLEQVLFTTGAMMPGVALILGGTSRTGCGHSVVVMDGEIFNDPAGSGIIGPMEDGFFWVTFFSPAPGPRRGPLPAGEIVELLQIAYETGFGASGEGYNGEYPFDQRGIEPSQDRHWVESRDDSLRRLFPALFQEGGDA